MPQFKKYKLGELYNVSSGLSKPREEFGFGHPFVTFKDVFYNFFLPTKLSELANTTEKEINSCSVRKGDIFLTRTSETMNELGMSSVALKDYPNATFNGFTKRLRKKEDVDVEIDPLYIGYYFRTIEIRNQISMHASMTTRASLNSTAINSIEISIPDIEYQIPIGQILKRLDDKIELNRRTNHTLEQIAQTLFKKYFVDDIDPENLPEGWRWGKLGEIFTQSKESISPGKHPEKSFHHYSIPSYDESRRPTIEFGSSILSNKFLVKSNSLLFSKLNPRFPRTWLIGSVDESKSICSTEFLVFMPIKPTHYSFTYLQLMQEDFMSDLVNKATGTSGSHQRIRPDDILELEAIIPHFRSLDDFEIKVRPLLKNIIENLNENLTLTKIRDSLLPKLMSGEIEVNVVEKELAEL